MKNILPNSIIQLFYDFFYSLSPFCMLTDHIMWNVQNGTLPFTLNCTNYIGVSHF